MTRLRFAVVPTHDRRNDYEDCYAAIRAQTDEVITVSHLAEYAKQPFVSYDEEVPNISVMWNLGLDYVHQLAAGDSYDVAVINDDCIVPPDWFDRVTQAMRYQAAAAGCVRRSFDPRMTGYAFILDGDKCLRADPQFRWWYGDDDLQRRAGVVAFADGEDVEHRHPNSTTVGHLSEIAVQDGQRFKAKWDL